ncbi:MAG: hypothetical protein AB8H80_01075 [Planctomycetota bacterium]
MTPEFYRLIHVACALLLFLSLGGVLLSPADKKAPKSAMILHGIALLAMLVAGFGYVHKSATVDWEAKWVYAKIGCWLLVGALPILIRKGILPKPVGLLVAVAAGAAAVWLAQAKPF